MVAGTVLASEATVPQTKEVMTAYCGLKRSLLLKTFDEWMKPTKKMNDVSHTAGDSRATVEINATGTGVMLLT